MTSFMSTNNDNNNNNVNTTTTTTKKSSSSSSLSYEDIDEYQPPPSFPKRVTNVEVTSYLPPPKAKERTPSSPESNGTNLDDTGGSNENMPRQKQIIEEDATVIDDALSVNSSSDEDEDDDSDEDDQNAIVGQIYWCNGYEQVLV